MNCATMPRAEDSSGAVQWPLSRTVNSHGLEVQQLPELTRTTDDIWQPHKQSPTPPRLWVA